MCDWLKREVAIKMEAAEMAHGLEQKPLGEMVQDPEPSLPRSTRRAANKNHHAYSVDRTVIRYGIARSMRHWP